MRRYLAACIFGLISACAPTMPPVPPMPTTPPVPGDPSLLGKVDKEHSGRLFYPKDMLILGRTGAAAITCDVGADGFNHACVVSGLTGGKSFGQVALKYVENSRCLPAHRNGVAVAVRYTWKIYFMIPQSVLAGHRSDWDDPAIGVTNGRAASGGMGGRH